MSFQYNSTVSLSLFISLLLSFLFSFSLLKTVENFSILQNVEKFSTEGVDKCGKLCYNTYAPTPKVLRYLLVTCDIFRGIFMNIFRKPFWSSFFEGLCDCVLDFNLFGIPCAILGLILAFPFLFILSIVDLINPLEV